MKGKTLELAALKYFVIEGIIPEIYIEENL